MKINKIIVILCVIAIVLIFLLIYSDSLFKPNPKNTVKNFLEEKVALYGKREEYILEKIDDEWKITKITPKSNRVFEDYDN